MQQDRTRTTAPLILSILPILSLPCAENVETAASGIAHWAPDNVRDEGGTHPTGPG